MDKIAVLTAKAAKARALAEKIAQKRNANLLNKDIPSMSKSKRIAKMERKKKKDASRYETGGFSHLGATGTATGNNRR